MMSLSAFAFPYIKFRKRTILKAARDTETPLLLLILPVTYH